MKRETNSFRLRKHAEYQRVYKEARKQFAREMSYFFWYRLPPSPPDADLSSIPTRNIPSRQPSIGPRVGLTVGKVLGNAVHRNRIKRRLRAAVRNNIALLDQCPADVILHPRRSVHDVKFAALDQEIATIFRSVARSPAKSKRHSAPAVLSAG